jgi:hypothetical protein
MNDIDRIMLFAEQSDKLDYYKKENNELKQQIEKMKCCGNCIHKMNLYGTCNKECECINYSNWELLE